MADIHPNDIGLATYADVGDVKKLRTVAKTIVEALNEVYETGTVGKEGISWKQVYVDGENNVIIGKNNMVYGHNNFIVGSNNIVLGDNHTLFKSSHIIAKSTNISIDSFDINTKRIIFYANPNEIFPYSVGDKVVFKANNVWSTSDWSDYLEAEIKTQVVEISDINISESYLELADLEVSNEPPDEIHTVFVLTSIYGFYVLNDNCKNNSDDGCITMGYISTGKNSMSVNNGRAKEELSFAANNSFANGKYTAALNNGTADKNYAFAANRSKVEAESGAGFNTSTCYNPYSLASGQATRIFGRAIKCVSIDTTAKTVKIEAEQNVSEITGKYIILRAINNSGGAIYYTAMVSSISGTTIYLTNASFGNSTLTLPPDKNMFVIDTSTSFGQSNFVGGRHCIATEKMSFAFGEYTCAVHDDSVIFGKYGLTDSSNGLFLANGTSLYTPGLAFKALSDGNVHADGSYTSPCADYAEFFEWKDGNPQNEDRAGYFVKLDGDKIVMCDEFDKTIGVVSAMPAIIGDSGEMHWQGKYVTDDFGRIQYHEVIVSAEKDEDGNVVIEEHAETQPVLNPEWNAEQEYIPRKDRPEWSPVGVLGKLIVYDDGTLVSGDICRPGEDGKAVKSIENGYTVLKRISDDKVLIWFKG